MCLITSVGFHFILKFSLIFHINFTDSQKHKNTSTRYEIAKMRVKEATPDVPQARIIDLFLLHFRTWFLNLTCKKMWVIALGLPPPYFENLRIVNNTRIRKGNAKHSRLCHGDSAVRAFNVIDNNLINSIEK